MCDALSGLIPVRLQVHLGGVGPSSQQDWDPVFHLLEALAIQLQLTGVVSEHRPSVARSSDFFCFKRSSKCGVLCKIS